MLTIDASRMTTKSAVASNTSAHQRRSTRRDDPGVVLVSDILRPLIEAALVGQEAAQPGSPDARDRGRPSAWAGCRRRCACGGGDQAGGVGIRDVDGRELFSTA